MRDIVTDSEVEKALDWLRDNAGDIGEAKRLAVKTDHMLKHIRALAMKHSGEASAAAKAMAEGDTFAMLGAYSALKDFKV